MNANAAFRAILAGLLLVAGPAHAQLFRAYLATDGNDANPCTLAQPCRLLPAALSAVASGGEIWMLDSANYNTSMVVIGKSVSIVAVPGVVGSLVALNGNPAVYITAPGLKVALRNVAIGPLAGATPGTHGVWMSGASALTVEGSLISNLPMRGIYVVGTGTLQVSDSTVRGNGDYAIYLQDGARAAISSTRILENFSGVVAWSNAPSHVTTAALSDCVISRGSTGAFALVNDGVARISVTRSTIERATVGLASQTLDIGTAEINVGSSMIVDNGNAWILSGTGSAILSLGNNQMSGNTGSIGTLTPLPGQ